MSTVALRRLDLLADEVPVLLGGSVLAARHPQLDDRIRESLASRAPKAVPRVVSERPVLGAALLNNRATDNPAILIGVQAEDQILVNPRQGEVGPLTESHRAIVLAFHCPDSLL